MVSRYADEQFFGDMENLRGQVTAFEHDQPAGVSRIEKATQNAGAVGPPTNNGASRQNLALSFFFECKGDMWVAEAFGTYGVCNK